LDHELVELCLSFAPSTLFQRGWTKVPLRLGLADVLPQQVARRKIKLGFEVPQGDWLRGPLRPLLEEWLRGDRFIWEYVDRSTINQIANSFWNGGSKMSGEFLFATFMADQWARIYGIAG